MKIVITGLTGFIGRNLCKQLLPGHEYFTIARGRRDFMDHVTVLEGDLNDLQGFKKQLIGIRPDICLHLAWEGIPDYGYMPSRRSLDSGVDFFRFLAQECGCRKIVATGSCWEYGKNFGPCREDQPAGPGTYFTWAKRALCDFGMSLALQEKVNFIWLRLFYVYGPGGREGSLLPSLARALKKGESPLVKHPLNANDFVYIDDVCRALMQAVLADVDDGIYNIGSGVSLPVWRVCGLMEDELAKGTMYARQWRETGGIQTANFWADTNKSRGILKWSAQTTMERGIREFLRGTG